ncbi:MAG: pentapeptide repeat-containing protein [Methanothrix sp.]
MAALFRVSRCQRRAGKTKDAAGGRADLRFCSRIPNSFTLRKNGNLRCREYDEKALVRDCTKFSTFIWQGEYTKRILAVIFIALFLEGAITDASSQQLKIVSSKEVSSKIVSGLPVEYDHVIIKGNIILDELDLPTNVKRVSAPLRINDSIIEGDIYFNDTIFHSPILLRGSFINGLVLSNGSLFKSTADFSGSLFNSTTDFNGSSFNSTGDFRNISFNNDVYFRGSTFNGDSIFRDSKFKSKVNLGYAKFNGLAEFERSEFNKDADFERSRFNGPAKFVAANFNGAAFFKDSVFNNIADFSYSKFNGSAYFEDSWFKKGTDFSFVAFEQDISFNSSRFYEAGIFDSTRFRGVLYLKRAEYNKLYIRWASISKLGYDKESYLLLIDNFKNLGQLDDANECNNQYEKAQQALSEKRDFDPIIISSISILLILLSVILVLSYNAYKRKILGEEFKGSLDRISKAEPRDVQEIAASQITLLGNYYEIALDQAQKSFIAAFVAAIIGLIFFLGSVSLLVFFNQINLTIIGIVGAAITEVISGLNFYLYNKSTYQLVEFLYSLNTTQRFLLANSICEGLEGEFKQQARSDLVRAIARENDFDEKKIINLN